MTNTMQITFAATEREKRQAGRRLCRYREPALRRKQWLGMAAFTLMIFAFFYGYGQLMANVGNTLYGNCHLFGDEAGLDTCLAVADSAYQSLRYMLYWLGALLLAVIFFQRWQYGNFIRGMFYPLDGRQFTIALSPEGLTHEEAGRVRHFYAWPMVYRIIEDKDFLLFYVDRNVAYFIPQAAFAAANRDSHAFFLHARQFKENI